MKKYVLLSFVLLCTLSLSACGSKKEPAPEPTPETKKETAVIDEEPVALAEEPEETVEEGFKCLDEMYSYKLEDGMLQVDDIIIDTATGGRLEEFLSPFVAQPERYIIDYSFNGAKRFEYDPNAQIDSSENFFIHISRRHGDNLLQFRCISLAKKDTSSALSDCYYLETEIAAKKKDETIWFAGGVRFNGEGLTLDNFEDVFFQGFTKNGDSKPYYKENGGTDKYKYIGELYSTKLISFPVESALHAGYYYSLEFDKNTRECVYIFMLMDLIK